MQETVCGVILAGGQATRMGKQPKGLLPLGRSTPFEQVIKRASPQVSTLIISSNEPLEEYQQSGLPVLADSLPGYLGPLAGILTAMEWAQQHAHQCQWLASFAVDTPFCPQDLVSQLYSQQSRTEKHATTEIICPFHGGYRHPTLSLWRIDQAEALRHALTQEHCYRLGAWLKQRDYIEADLSHLPDASFFNINTPQDLAYAQAHYLELLL